MSEQKFDERFEKLVIDPEELEKSFRFETVAKEYALAKADLKIYTAKKQPCRRCRNPCKGRTLLHTLERKKLVLC